MVDLPALQREVYENKVRHGFNVENMQEEFCLLMTETAEAYRAYCRETKEAFAEELADITIYVLGMAEIAGVDLEMALLKKIEKNAKRKYVLDEHGHYVKAEE